MEAVEFIRTIQKNVRGDRLRCLPAERKERMQRVLRGGSSGSGANCRGMGKGTSGGSEEEADEQGCAAGGATER